MSDKYILRGREVVPVSLMEWAAWFATATERHLAKTDVAGAHVSTVFLGINHSFGGGPPLLFETMVFGGPLDGEQERYSTFDEAEAGHAAMVEKVKAHGTH